MSEKNKSQHSSKNSLGGCLGTLVGIATFVATFSLGPVDFGRSVYNQLIGDTPVLKRQLTDYVRSGIARENPSLTPAELEQKLANVIGAPPVGTSQNVDPEQTSIEKLWDAGEEYAGSTYQQWFWSSLK